MVGRACARATQHSAVGLVATRERNGLVAIRQLPHAAWHIWREVLSGGGTLLSDAVSAVEIGIGRAGRSVGQHLRQARRQLCCVSRERITEATEQRDRADSVASGHSYSQQEDSGFCSFSSLWKFSTHPSRMSLSLSGPPAGQRKKKAESQDPARPSDLPSRRSEPVLSTAEGLRSRRALSSARARLTLSHFRNPLAPSWEGEMSWFCSSCSPLSL